jgi:uncharacterized protein (TIGR02453 family)
MSDPEPAMRRLLSDRHMMEHRERVRVFGGVADKDGSVGVTDVQVGSFSTKATAFFAGLERDNSKDYWTANKAVFEKEVREPMADLLDSLPERWQPFKAFRMNRDIRFSPDKSPYKTQHGAAHEIDGTVYYVHFDARGLMAACGAHMMAPDQLDRYRQAVASDATGRALQDMLQELSQLGFEVGHGMGEPLKTAPRGYPKDHPRVDLLRQKVVSAHRRLTGGSLRDAAAVRQFVVDSFDACEPMNDWIRSNIGPTRTESGRR